jgi:hypothetical protein
VSKSALWRFASAWQLRFASQHWFLENKLQFVQRLKDRGREHNAIVRNILHCHLQGVIVFIYLWFI